MGNEVCSCSPAHEKGGNASADTPYSKSGIPPAATKIVLVGPHSREGISKNSRGPPPTSPWAANGPRRLDHIFVNSQGAQNYFFAQGADGNLVQICESLHSFTDQLDARSIQHLLENGANRINVDIADPDGNSCLHKAAWLGNVDICRLLLKVITYFRRPHLKQCI